MPLDKHALEDFWKSRFGDVPIDSIRFEPPSLSVCDIARAVNLPEGRLTRYIDTLKKNRLIVCNESVCSIKSKGKRVFAKLDKLLNDPSIRPLIENLERTTSL
jgi:predicted transcriptional regulator